MGKLSLILEFLGIVGIVLGVIDYSKLKNTSHDGEVFGGIFFAVILVVIGIII